MNAEKALWTSAGLSACIVACLLLSALPLVHAGEAKLGEPLEKDADSGAQVYLLGGDERDANNVYGEQAYSDPTGRWILVQYLNQKGDKGPCLSVIDLTDGSRRDIGGGGVAGHAWGEYVYFQQESEGKRMLRRCRYDTLKIEDVAQIPAELGRVGWSGTVSPDRRYFALCNKADKKAPAAKVHLLDIEGGKWSVLLDKPDHWCKHEQFSLDGRNRLMILFGHTSEKPAPVELEIGGKERRFPVGSPHTPNLSGHLAWIGTSDRICVTGDKNTDPPGMIWSAKVGDEKPTLVSSGPRWFYHIGVSRCGRYWVADTFENGVPIYVGNFASGKWKRAVFSRTPTNATETHGHTHTYLTADNKWLIFTSQRDGHAQVYGAKLAEKWLESLEK
jgi:hypothetical protein